MYEIGIFTEDKGWQSWKVSECEAAYEVYHMACDLAEKIGAINTAIWDAETGEVLADFSGEWEE